MELIGDTDAQECLQRLKRFVNQQGLGNFYDVTTLTAKATVAATMRRGMNRQYNWELASEFITLTLYDIAILIGLGPDLFYSIPTSRTIAPGRQPHQTPRQTGNIDDSSSVREGLCIEIIKSILHDITEVYDLANPEGILSVRFTNTSKGKGGVTSQEAKTLLHKHKYRGVARIGTQLEKKILNPLVWGSKPMTKPLLVIIITAGSNEGRVESDLVDVILNCIQNLGARKNAVAFQISCIGSKREGGGQLDALLDHRVINGHADCIAVTAPMDEFPEHRQLMLVKLLVGAYSPVWRNMHSDEFGVGGVELNEQREMDLSDEDK